MRNAFAHSLAFGVLTSILAVPSVALADPITIGGGTIAVFSPRSGIDWAGFQLTSSDSSFTGVVLGGVVALPSGGVATINGSAGFTSTVPFPLATQQIVQGTAYQSFVTGSLNFSTPTFVVPPPGMAGTPFEFSAPFTANGHIAGKAILDVSAPVQFSVDLAGSGIATVRGQISDSAQPFYNVLSAAYQFEAASPASPTPEPASVLLLLAGGIVGVRTVRARFNGVRE